MKQANTQKPPQVRVGMIPTIKLPPVRPVDVSEAARIKALIQQLAQIDKPDFGLSPSMTGMAFAPIPDSGNMSMMVLADHNLQHATPLVELVRIGPRALPFLLEALEDTTPTQLVVKHGRIIMMLEHLNEMWGNPANVREQKALSEKPKRDFNQAFVKDPPTSHTVTIGDVCFVIIGQITGRHYQAVRYQPSGIIVINSPTYDPSIVKAARAIWASENPTQYVLDSLLLDYATGRIEAAMRLLYYFPKQTAPIIAKRLQSFQVQNTRFARRDEYSDTDLARWEKREAVNGFRTDNFIEAIRWCKQSEVKSALLYLFQKSNDPELLLAMLPAIDGARHWPLIERRFQIFLGLLRPADSNWNGVNGFEVLIALHKAGGSKARPYYRKYLRPNSPKRCFAVCAALQVIQGEWDREFLWPMLTDKRFDKEEAQQYPPGSRERQQPRRVCDSAARVIAQHRKDVAFKRVGTTLELDRQITQMQLQLKKTR